MFFFVYLAVRCIELALLLIPFLRIMIPVHSQHATPHLSVIWPPLITCHVLRSPVDLLQRHPGVPRRKRLLQDVVRPLWRRGVRQGQGDGGIFGLLPFEHPRGQSDMQRYGGGPLRHPS